MKVLLVIESGGGSGRHLVDLASGLCGKGCQVSVVYSPTRLELHYLSLLQRLPLYALVPLVMYREVKAADIVSLLKLRKFISATGPFDVIHGHSSKAGALARLAAPPMSARVYTPHSFRTMDPMLPLAQRYAYGSIEAMLGRVATDGLITVSDEEMQHAKYLGIPENKIHLVLNGIEAPAHFDREIIRENLGIGSGEIAVGFVGRLSAQKNPRRFVEAIQIARMESPTIRGVIFGDGELRNEIVGLARGDVGIVSGVNAQDYMIALDIFVLTSNYEGMPYVFVEALHAGLPIITSDVGGVRAAIRSGVNGTVLQTLADARSFATKIVELAANEPLRRSYGQASGQLAQEMTADKMVCSTLEAYRQAIDRRRGERISLR